MHHKKLWGGNIFGMRKGGGIVNGVILVEIPQEGDKEDRGINGTLAGGDVDARRGAIDGEK